MRDHDSTMGWRRQVPALLAALFTTVAGAQQQIPPRPEATVVKRPPLAAAAVAERPLVHPDAFKAQVFKGTGLNEMQIQAVLGNLAGVGLSQQTAPKTMQQFFGPVPPAQATGMACVVNYAGTAAELVALRKTVAAMVEKNKASDLPVFVKGIPQNCPYKELYYYLELLAQLTKE